jgi:uncharacterized protein (TIGR02265 family)
MDETRSNRPNTDGTRVKGASLIARMEYVVEKGGSELRERVLERLSADDRRVLENRPLPSSLFPLSLNARLDEAIAITLNPLNKIAVYRELGRASAQKNLHRFHAIFLQGKSPHDLLSGFPAVRATYYSDGEASYEKTGDRSGVFRVKGAESHSRPDCESTAGYFERAIELLGGHQAKVELARCRHRGDPVCEFPCAWA